MTPAPPAPLLLELVALPPVPLPPVEPLLVEPVLDEPVLDELVPVEPELLELALLVEEPAWQTPTIPLCALQVWPAGQFDTPFITVHPGSQTPVWTWPVSQ
jgi:hypothetical protein